MEFWYKKRIEFRKEEGEGRDEKKEKEKKRIKRETQILLCIKQNVKPNKIK